MICLPLPITAIALSLVLAGCGPSSGREAQSELEAQSEFSKPLPPAALPSTALPPLNGHDLAGDTAADSSGGMVDSTSELPFQPVMVRIPAGRFLMGNVDGPLPEHLAAYADQIAIMQQCEQPRHAVQITRPFEISDCEVTVQQFRNFVHFSGYVTEAESSGTGANGLNAASDQVVQKPECVWTSPGFPQTDQHPVVCVSWQDAMAYCAWLSTQTGRRWRLPTEAEWEYCCRAGSDTVYASGDNDASLQEYANCGDQALAAYCSLLTSAAPWNDGFAFTAPVRSFRPNALGLYDMHGNVGEWCADWFQANYYQSSTDIDPTGPDAPQEWRVVRGGSWYNMPFSCRSSGRHDSVPTAASTTNGFRVVRELPEARH